MAGNLFRGSTPALPLHYSYCGEKMGFCVLSWQSAPCSSARFLMTFQWRFKRVQPASRSAAQLHSFSLFASLHRAMHTCKPPSAGPTSATVVWVSLHGSLSTSQCSLRSLDQSSSKRNPSRVQWFMLELDPWQSVNIVGWGQPHH